MSVFFGAGGMGGNVERHIGDDDRDGAAIEALQPGAATPRPAGEAVPVRSWEGRPFNDAWINEITMDVLGHWPSFEAQSWACKVVHAACAAHPPQPSASVVEALQLADDMFRDLGWHSKYEITSAALRALKGDDANG